VMNVRPQRRQLFLYPGEEVKPSREPKLRLQGTTTRAVETGRMRLIVTAGLFGFAFAMIGIRIVDLMVLNDGPSVSSSSSRGVARAPTARADILDRNGVIVATNLPTVNLYADTHKVPDARLAADKLTATLPDMKYADIIKHLASGQRFIYLRRNLTPAEQMSVNRLGIPGLSFEDSESRAYPHSSLFAHVVGVTDPDNHGLAGVEKTFDDVLGQRQDPLRLSLDVRVQHAVRESLAESIVRFRAAGGSAVVMDAHNGEILSMVSMPDYDPKIMGTASKDSRFNRTTLGLYEMGSTFKLFTAAMALEAGTAQLSSRYDASAPIKIGRFTITDYHGLNRWEAVPEILIHSSNIGAAKMALEAGADTQKAFLRKIGLLSPLRLELPEVGTPQFPSTWRDINTITISYGHGISVTPVHVVSAVSALVNGGVLYPPTIIHRAPGNAPEGRRVISDKNSEAMRAMMRMVVLYGSGKQADAKGYMVGGKTGSAEKTTKRGGYSESSLRTSFVGAFPIDAPRYVVLVLLDEPRGTKETYNFATAGWNAAPTVGNIVTKIGPMLGVFPMGHEDNFQPLTGLMQIYGPNEGGKSEYGATNAPVVVKASAPPAPAATTHNVSDDEEETTKVSVTRTISDDSAPDSIGELIDDMSVQELGPESGAGGGIGAAQ
jgi:cell division protein FtsI (penicillin-binding protein 3)